MKKLTIVLAAAAMLLTSCTGQKRTQAERLLSNYAEVLMPAPDLSGITDNGKEVLNLYRFAADEVDNIYWKQNFGDKSLMASLSDPAARQYALVNYGPWDRIDGKPFVEGYGEKPLGARFYPEDMTPAEFDAFDDPLKNSPYTLVRRTEKGDLETVWYHDAYAENIDKICSYLTAAADLTIKPSVRDYLLAKVEALRTDSYYASDAAWLKMEDSKMDLVLGPNENVDDALYGAKASYGAYVLLKNLDRTAQLNSFASRLPEFQQMLPCEESYRSFVPATGSDIFACDVIYYGGYTNAGFKVIAINFPYDEREQEELGTRTILFDNVIRDKFNRTLFPVGQCLIGQDQQANLDVNAFYWTIAFREISKGLGVKETMGGNSVAEALADMALVFEKAKSNLLGAYLCMKLVQAHEIPALISREDVLTTFVANVIRSCRFGNVDATGKANIIIYNSLLEKGAIQRLESGRYTIDNDLVEQLLKELGAFVLKIQATGDYESARAFADAHSEIGPTLQADKVVLEKENIPVDIRFTYAK